MGIGEYSCKLLSFTLNSNNALSFYMMHVNKKGWLRDKGS